MLARPFKRCEGIVNWVRRRRRHAARHIEWQRGRAREGGTHQCHRAEYVRPDERAPGGDRRPEVVPHHAGHGTIAERRNQPQCVPHEVDQAERPKVAVVPVVPAGGAPIAPLVGRDDAIPRGSEGQHHLSPTVGEFRKAMQEEHAGTVARGFAGLQNMHGQAVDAVYLAGADAGREGSFA